LTSEFWTTQQIEFSFGHLTDKLNILPQRRSGAEKRPSASLRLCGKKTIGIKGINWKGDHKNCEIVFSFFSFELLAI